MKIAIARQPILDRKRTVYGYALHFRDGLDHAFQALNLPDDTEATTQGISNSLLMFGLDALVGEGKAFIHVTREVLLKGHMHLLPTDTVVPQVPGSSACDREVIEACRGLQTADFQLALDDGGAENGGPLSEFARFIQVDFRRASEDRQRNLVDTHGGRDKKMIAAGIEDYDAFGRAKDLGYDYFQGYFFAKPETLLRQEIPGSHRQHLELLRGITRSALSFDELHDIIKRDVSLTYRLLRYLNSPSLGFRSEVGSIRQALVLLGEREIRRWATLISMSAIGRNKPSELLITTLTRARFLETLSARNVEKEQDHFLLGMFSLLDAVMDQPLDHCLKGVPLAESIRDALLGQPGHYRQMLELVACYERGEWDRLSQLTAELGVPHAEIPEIYLAATRWARETYGAVSSAGRTRRSGLQDA